jgi:hypothetical protein
MVTSGTLLDFNLLGYFYLISFIGIMIFVVFASVRNIYNPWPLCEIFVCLTFCAMLYNIHGIKPFVDLTILIDLAFHFVLIGIIRICATYVNKYGR